MNKKKNWEHTIISRPTRHIYKLYVTECDSTRVLIPLSSSTDLRLWEISTTQKKDDRET